MLVAGRRGGPAGDVAGLVLDLPSSGRRLTIPGSRSARPDYAELDDKVTENEFPVF